VVMLSVPSGGYRRPGRAARVSLIPVDGPAIWLKEGRCPRATLHVFLCLAFGVSWVGTRSKEDRGRQGQKKLIVLRRPRARNPDERPIPFRFLPWPGPDQPARKRKPPFG